MIHSYNLNFSLILSKPYFSYYTCLLVSSEEIIDYNSIWLGLQFWASRIKEDESYVYDSLHIETIK